ncbi:MAG: hypothetical protein NTW87_13525 [Planctomycetota bacterium]|nr:hypothetical protein [Planctomycetota bacterium]
MSIYFRCAGCGKALFAQDQFGGRDVVCPACQAKHTIPLLLAAEQALPASGQTAADARPAAKPEAPPEELLVDMEKSPLPVASQTYSHAAPPVLAGARAEDGTQGARLPAEGLAGPAGEQEKGSAPGQAGSEPTKACPMCAETIKASAKKCRFCGTILDEGLRAEEEQRRREQALASMLAVVERTANAWRVLAVIVTACTVGWLVLLTMMTWGKAPATLTVFNILLVVGLVWSTRQMRQGPHNVFIAAAFAVAMCMPLDMALGLNLVDDEVLKELQKQDPKNFGTMTAQDLNGGIGVLFCVLGFMFAIPVWIAALKVAVAQRLRASLGARKAEGGERSGASSRGPQ